MNKAYKNYFPLPNVIFSLNLSPGEIAIYSYLLYCEDRKPYQCHPGYKTIGRAVVMSVNIVQKLEIDATISSLTAQATV